MKRIQFAVLGLLVLLIGFPTVFADYTDNWAAYPSGTVSPSSPGNPWTQTTLGTAACFTGSEVTNVQGGNPGPFNSASPNVYIFEGSNAGGCGASAGNSVTLTATVNATSTTVILSFYYYVTTTTVSNSTVWGFNVSVCGSTLSSLVGLDHATAKWYHVTDTVATSGSTCAPSGNVFLQLFSVNSGAAHAVTVQIANVVIKGANAELTKANLFLETFINQGGVAHNQWFNITDFANSYVIVNYTTGPAYIIRNMTTPDVFVPLTSATLVTVYVGQYCSTVSGTLVCTSPYFRSVIPTSTTHQIVYLDSPIGQTVLQYIIQVADYSQEFPSGTEIFVYGGIASLGSSPIASGYLDGNSQFSVGLVPGRYSVKLMNGPNTFLSSVTFGVSNLEDTIIVPGIKIQTPASEQSSLLCIGFWNPGLTTITGYYDDNTTTTTSVTIALMDINGSGTYFIASSTFSPGPYGNVNNVFANGSGYFIFHKYSLEYRIVCTITNTFGTGYVYPNANGQPVLGGIAGNFGPSFPDVLHLAAFLPNLSDGTGQVGGLGILTAVAAGFGEFFGPIGLLITAFVAAYLFSSGWLVISSTLGVVLVILSVVGRLTWLERRNR